MTRITASLALFTILCITSQPAQAEGALRDRIKERVRERLADAPAPADTVSPSAPITKPGDYRFSIEQGGHTRSYLVHVPRTYVPGKPTPLLLAFHGGGGSADHMAKDNLYGLTSKSEEAGFILVYPNGYSKLPSGKFATWNAGACCADARDRNIDDVAFVRSILKNVSGQLAIDSSRIFATGMSNGGMMSHRLACDMAGTFKAIAAVAGTDNTLNCTPAKPVSILQIHALDDDRVLFKGGAGSGAFKDTSKVTDFTSVPITVSKWAVRNGCAPEPKRVLTVPGAYCDLYDECKGGTQVKLCVTETGGHSWPGGYKPQGAPTSTALSANDQMWDFFMSLP